MMITNIPGNKALIGDPTMSLNLINNINPSRTTPSSSSPAFNQPPNVPSALPPSLFNHHQSLSSTTGNHFSQTQKHNSHHYDNSQSNSSIEINHHYGPYKNPADNTGLVNQYSSSQQNHSTNLSQNYQPYHNHHHHQQVPIPRTRTRRVKDRLNTTNNSISAANGFGLGSSSPIDPSTMSPTNLKSSPLTNTNQSHFEPTPSHHHHHQQAILLQPQLLQLSVPEQKLLGFNHPIDQSSPIRPSFDLNQNRRLNTLHRNKACLNCRARKTKCDAIKPVCSSCKRLGQSQPIECKYDQPPKWLSDVVSSSQSKEKKRLAELQAKLESLQSKFRQLQLDRSVQEHNNRQLASFCHLLPNNEDPSLHHSFRGPTPPSATAKPFLGSDSQGSDSSSPSSSGMCGISENSQNNTHLNTSQPHEHPHHQHFPNFSKPPEPFPIHPIDQFSLKNQIFLDPHKKLRYPLPLPDPLTFELSAAELSLQNLPHLIEASQSLSNHPLSATLNLTAPQTSGQLSSSHPALVPSEFLPWIPQTSMAKPKPFCNDRLDLGHEPQAHQSLLTSSALGLNSTSQPFPVEPVIPPPHPPSSINSAMSSFVQPNPTNLPPRPMLNSHESESAIQHHLPSMKICKNLIRAFINKPLCPFNLIEPVDLLKRVEAGPFHPNFPTLGLIHSICAVGAQYVSQPVFQQYYEKVSEPIDQHHIRWAEFYLESELNEYHNSNRKDGNRMVEIGQGYAICSQYYNIKGLPLMMWKCLGFVMKICTTLGLDREGRVENDESVEGIMIWPDGVKNFDLPKTQEEYHYRSLLWWYTFCCERMCSAAAGFGLTVSEVDAREKWICCNQNGPDRNKHDPKSDEFFLHHDQPEFDDDDEGDGNGGSRGALQLLVKAAILLGRVCCTVYRRSSLSKPSEESDQEKESLSNLITRFYNSFPKVYKTAFKLNSNGGLNSCLLSAHALVHSCMIALHEDGVKRIDLEDPEMKICTDSSRILINWFHAVTHQNIDIGDLLCSNPTLAYALGLTLRAHCKLIAFTEALGNYKAGQSLRLELEKILETLRRCTKLPMRGRVLRMVTEYLKDLSILLPKTNNNYPQVDCQDQNIHNSQQQQSQQQQQEVIDCGSNQMVVNDRNGIGYNCDGMSYEEKDNYYFNNNNDDGNNHNQQNRACFGDEEKMIEDEGRVRYFDEMNRFNGEVNHHPPPQQQHQQGGGGGGQQLGFDDYSNNNYQIVQGPDNFNVFHPTPHHHHQVESNGNGHIQGNDNGYNNLGQFIKI